VPVKDIDGFGGFGVRCDGTFKQISEEEATLLDLSQDFLVGLSCRGNGQSGEKIAGETGEWSIGGIEKFGVCLWGGSREQQGLNVNGAETRGPFETLQAASDVLGRSELAAAIARQ
jgi:hypothetical protein